MLQKPAGTGREQSLEANGHLAHGTMALPAREPGQYLFDLPQAAYADGKPLELKFIKKGGANAVVSDVRLWSIDPRHLPGGSVWQPNDPVEKDWRRQDRLRGTPRFGATWEDPAKEVSENVVPAVDEQLARGRNILADLAAQRTPSTIEPPAWGVQPMDYRTLVQPVLDKHCIRTEGGPMIREIVGTPYLYGGGDDVAEPWSADLAFDERELQYEIAGLDEAKQHRIGFSWWDYDNAGREHSLVARAAGQTVELLPRTKLPAWRDRQEKPGEHVVSVPERLSAAGALRLSVVNRTEAPNAVVSEVWVIECR